MKATFANLLHATAMDAGLTDRLTRRVLDSFFAQVRAAVWAQGRVLLPGFVTLRVHARKPHRITNPQTGEPMVLPSGRAVVCRVASSWRRRDG